MFMMPYALLVMLVSGAFLSFLFGAAVGETAETSPIEERLQRLERQVMQERGRRLYREACAPCHGMGGNGQGPAAQGLHSKPQDFTQGMYKFRSTPIDAMPTDDDLMRSISEGIPGTAMPAWKNLLSASQRLALVQYLKTFAPEAFAASTTVPVTPLRLPPAPTSTPAGIDRGRAIYDRLQCGQCHGQRGRGDGPLAAHLRDVRNRPSRPQDFTKGIYKSGDAPDDLLRTVMTGLAGTPMPAWASAISIDEGWDLVDYIRSLSRSRTLWQVLFVHTGEATPGR
jgi:cytochrome c oxidase cbb3-type subunit 2